jgi:agmatinase
MMVMLHKADFLNGDQAFLGLPAEDAALPSQARAVVIPFGLEHSVSYGKGTRVGPAAILAASPQLEMFDEEFWCEPHRKIGITTLKPVTIKTKLPEALAQLASRVSAVLDAGKFPLVLGGEHSLTAGAVRPFAERHKNLTILHFDAHADLRDGYEGEDYSHAAALRRCLDLPNLRLVSLGIRNISAGEADYLAKQKKRITIFWGKDKAQWRLPEILRAVGKGPVYLTFDLDGFDSSLMPATGTPEPGGLFWQEAMTIIRAVAQQSRIVGADIVELAPQKGLHACDFLAAKLAYKILTYSFLAKSTRPRRAKAS